MSKVIERVIRLDITFFLDSNGLMEETKHGSRYIRGTMFQLIKQHDLLTERLAKNIF